MPNFSPDSTQSNFLYPDLIDQLNPKHPLLKLAKVIPWDHFEAQFAPLYSDQGKPAKPVRLMVGLSILKHLEDLSDEVLVNRWVGTGPLCAYFNFILHAKKPQLSCSED